MTLNIFLLYRLTPNNVSFSKMILIMTLSRTTVTRTFSRATVSRTKFSKTTQSNNTKQNKIALN